MFKYDSPIMTGLRKLLNLILISAMWLLLCVPVITAGASTTAYYHSIDKYMKYDLGYAAPEFIKSFRQNFRTATLCWLVILAGLMVCFLDLAAVATVAEKNNAIGGLDILFYILIAVLLVYGVWVFGYVSRYENSVKETLKNALIFMIAYLPTSLGILLLLGFAAFVVWLIPVSVLFMPGISIWFSSYLIEKVLKRYQENKENKENTETINTKPSEE